MFISGKVTRRLSLLLTLSTLAYLQGFAQDSTIFIPVGGNTWGNKHDDKTGGDVWAAGIVNWSSAETWFTTYFRVSDTGKIHVNLLMSAPDGKSTIRFMKGLQFKDIDLKGSGVRPYDAGYWTIKDTGYQAFTIKGVEKAGNYFAYIEGLELNGKFGHGINFIPGDKNSPLKANRQAPYVYLRYHVPKQIDVEWFYNEITVPQGSDLIGSYFEADGFGQGYFGMQVNSPERRAVIFSVWSPYSTDDPKQIPDSMKVLLIKKGKHVVTKEFGNEGSGAQSYLDFPWKADNTYGFLVRAKPGDDYTDFTAWFYAPEKKQWFLIACWRRPKTRAYLKGLYSFVEDYLKEYSNETRIAYFSNQWACNTGGTWIPLPKAFFSANKNARMDYAAGVKNKSFFLRSGGFFSDYTPLDTWFERSVETNSKPPHIDFDKLP